MQRHSTAFQTPKHRHQTLHWARPFLRHITQLQSSSSKHRARAASRHATDMTHTSSVISLQWAAGKQALWAHIPACTKGLVPFPSSSGGNDTNIGCFSSRICTKVANSTGQEQRKFILHTEVCSLIHMYIYIHMCIHACICNLQNQATLWFLRASHLVCIKDNASTKAEHASVQCS